MFTDHNRDAVRRMYESDEALRIRQETHELYSSPSQDYLGWALGCVHWRGDERILDIGCGRGTWYQRLQEQYPNVQYVGLDLFAGMLENHPLRNRVLVADAARLPHPDGFFDVVMANHMLFHVPDMNAVVTEIRRVLKPDGLLMAATNSVHNLPELQVLFRRAITLLTPAGSAVGMMPVYNDGFTLESGTRLLARHFYGVVRYDIPGTFVFPSVDPVLAYIESTRSLREPLLPPGIDWDEVMLIIREQVNRLVEHFGELVMNKLAGVLVASDQGDFVADYLAHLNQPSKTP
jgi:SAM-dependent methyltransferase